MIVVGAKPMKTEKEKQETKAIDWQEFSQNLVAQATSILTVWVLATRL